MVRGGGGSDKVDMMSPSSDNEKTQVVGRQIWRVVPYAKRYPGRVFSGIFSNALARVFDLMPFVAIGYSIDYFTNKGKPCDWCEFKQRGLCSAWT